MFPSIVADIGGTNARFALVVGEQAGQFVIENISILNGSEYATFSDALRAYMSQLDGVKVHSACVAIAGPVEGDAVKMTNLSWSFSQAAVCEEFAFNRFIAINDFASLAVATSALLPGDLVSLRDGLRDPRGNKAILGPGTGLGVAGLAYTGKGWLPIPSEGGHVNIAPATPLECEVIKAAMARHGHVSAEVFISGPGLVNLYKVMCDVNGAEPRSLEPKNVTAEGVSGEDQNCRQTLDVFCSFIGSLAGNIALTYGAKGGVYLGGGVLPRIADFLKASDFNQRFSDKGVMSKYVKDIPVDLISHPHLAILGSAAWLAQF
ncbi:glucokinase [Alteromonadaceae bacterium Bs31]|nr:glucokinase [Alteromonadaceae bacterium Bs31]